MQDRVGAAADRLEVDLSSCGMEQRQDLARATPDILVRPDCRVTLRPPTAARLRYSLERARLVLAPDRQTPRPPDPWRGRAYRLARSAPFYRRIRVDDRA